MEKVKRYESDVLVDLYVLSDMDRFTLDTEKAFTLLLEVADEAGVSRQGIEAEYARHKEIGKSFNAAGFVEGVLNEQTGEKWESAILPRLIERGNTQDLLMPGAQNYLDELTRLAMPHGLYTYGSWSNEVADPGKDRDHTVKWQLGKAAASHVLRELRTAVAETPDKIADLMRNRVVELEDEGKVVRVPDELSLTPGGVTYARHIVMGEDKISALQGGDPDLVSGILVIPKGSNRNAHHEAVDEISLPSYVTRYDTLDDAATSLEARISDIMKRIDKSNKK